MGSRKEQFEQEVIDTLGNNPNFRVVPSNPIQGLGLGSYRNFSVRWLGPSHSIILIVPNFDAQTFQVKLHNVSPESRYDVQLIIQGVTTTNLEWTIKKMISAFKEITFVATSQDKS